MPRQPRLLLARSYYHIMNRGNNRAVVFQDPEDYEYYLWLVGRFKDLHPVDIFHYCLMPNHVHLLIRTKTTPDFAEFMKKTNLAYYHYIHRKYDFVGRLWQGRFKSQPVGHDEYFIHCGKYIEQNPVRAGLVILPEEYTYSSYRHYVYGLADSLITDDWVFESLGDTPKERSAEYHSFICDSVVTDTYGKQIWGTPPERYNEAQKVLKVLKRAEDRRRSQSVSENPVQK